MGPVGQSGVLATAIPNAGALQPLLAALQGITNTQQQRQAQAVKLFNVNVKVINPEKKSNFETYVLRAVGPTNVFTVLQLKQQILKQFGPVIVPLALDYPVGYTKGGGSKVWIRTDADIKDIWSFLNAGDSVSLWCHGVSSSKEVDTSDEDDGVDPSTKKPKQKKRKKATTYSYLELKNDRVDERVEQLRRKHGNNYLGTQYRLWAEMLDIGTHK